jgi:transketolase
LDRATLRVAVEAGTSLGWEQFIGEDGIFVGMDTFGESAPAGELFEHFGITPKAVADRVIAQLNKR